MKNGTFVMKDLGTWEKHTVRCGERTVFIQKQEMKVELQDEAVQPPLAGCGGGKGTTKSVRGKKGGRDQMNMLRRK